MLGINLKLPVANFGEHTAAEGVCLTLQISPGRGEAGAALQGAKNLHLKGEVSKRETRREKVPCFIFLLLSPISALLCSAATAWIFHLQASNAPGCF